MSVIRIALLQVANYAAPRCNGHSVAFDEMGFDSEGKSRDTLVMEAGEERGIRCGVRYGRDQSVPGAGDLGQRLQKTANLWPRDVSQGSAPLH